MTYFHAFVGALVWFKQSLFQLRGATNKIAYISTDIIYDLVNDVVNISFTGKFQFVDYDTILAPTGYMCICFRYFVFHIFIDICFGD